VSVPAWHVLVVIDGNTRTLVIEADSAAAAVGQLAAHRAAGAAGGAMIRPYRTPDGDRLHIRWGRATVAEIGPAWPAASG
jgi:hypothetical protein